MLFRRGPFRPGPPWCRPLSPAARGAEFVPRVVDVQSSGLFMKAGWFSRTPGPNGLVQSVKGVGFTPSVVILFLADHQRNREWTGLGSSPGPAIGAWGDAQHGNGMFGGALVFQGTFTKSAWQTAAVFRLQSNSGGAWAECAVTGAHNDGFLVTWGINNTFNTTLIGYLALGGNSLLASVHTLNLPTATGNWSKTGLGFKPTVVLFFGARLDTAGTYVDLAGNGGLHLGAMDELGNQWAASVSSTQAATVDCEREYRSDCAIVGTMTGAQTDKHAFVSMNPDGYTLNALQVNGVAGQIGAVAIGGGAVGSVGTLVVPAAPGQQVISGFARAPRGIFFVSSTSALSTIAPNERLSVGASTPQGNHVGAMVTQADNVTNAIEGEYFGDDASIALCDNDWKVVESAAKATVFGDNSITLDWAKTGNVGIPVGYVAFAFSEQPMVGTGAMGGNFHVNRRGDLSAWVMTERGTGHYREGG